jgi:hypothetical protein
MVYWGIFLAILVGLGIWLWRSGSYTTIKDLVTFPASAIA